MEKEIEEYHRPSVFTYNFTDKKLHPKAVEFSFAKDKREKTPSPDRRQGLNVNVFAVKKRPTSVGILPKHKITDSFIVK
jgi:hypothetical protein